MLKSKSTILLLLLELVSFLFFVVESFTVWNPTTKSLKGQQSCRSKSCLHYSLFPEEEEEESVDQFEVEEILDSRPADGGTEYLVKWMGYDEPSDNSWEPESNIHPDLVAEYEASVHAQ